MAWVDHIEGSLPADDLRRAFVMGAKWWEFLSTGGTMWPSDVRLAEEKAEKVFPNGKPPEPSTNRLNSMPEAGKDKPETEVGTR